MTFGIIPHLKIILKHPRALRHLDLQYPPTSQPQALQMQCFPSIRHNLQPLCFQLRSYATAAKPRRRLDNTLSLDHVGLPCLKHWGGCNSDNRIDSFSNGRKPSRYGAKLFEIAAGSLIKALGKRLWGSQEMSLLGIRTSRILRRFGIWYLRGRHSGREWRGILRVSEIESNNVART
jgi:hypothetical protein